MKFRSFLGLAAVKRAKKCSQVYTFGPLLGPNVSFHIPPHHILCPTGDMKKLLHPPCSVGEHLHHCEERADLLHPGRHQVEHVWPAGKRRVGRSEGSRGEGGEEEEAEGGEEDHRWESGEGEVQSDPLIYIAYISSSSVDRGGN